MPADTSAQAAVTRVVNDYLDGMIYGDEAMLRRAFHPDCPQIGHLDGRFEYENLDQFIAWIRGETVLEPGTPYYSEIVTIDLAGDMAMVKVVDDAFGSRFTDYLTLVRHEGRWLIVSKTYYVHP
ncbi:MAG: nuclear transport factor 2 family protein [Hyphomicrobiales bacterium]